MRWWQVLNVCELVPDGFFLILPQVGPDGTLQRLPAHRQQLSHRKHVSDCHFQYFIWHVWTFLTTRDPKNVSHVLFSCFKLPPVYKRIWKPLNFHVYTLEALVFLCTYLLIFSFIILLWQIHVHYLASSYQNQPKTKNKLASTLLKRVRENWKSNRNVESGRKKVQWDVVEWDGKVSGLWDKCNGWECQHWAVGVIGSRISDNDQLSLMTEDENMEEEKKSEGWGGW